MTSRGLEALSAELHAIYQKEARRQAGTGEDEVRHPDDYDALPEHTKEYDRVLARYILQREKAIEQRYRTLIAALEGQAQQVREARDAHAANAERLRSILDERTEALAEPLADRLDQQVLTNLNNGWSTNSNPLLQEAAAHIRHLEAALTAANVLAYERDVLSKAVLRSVAAKVEHLEHVLADTEVSRMAPRT